MYDDQVVDDMIDAYFEEFDELFLAGDFTKADIILKGLDPGELGVAIAIAVLSITLAARDRLSQRWNFYERTRNYLRSICDEGRTSRLLGGLE